MPKFIILFLSILLSCCHSEAFANKFEIDIPNNATTAWIASELSQSGLLLSIKTFNSSDSVSDVLSFYREKWYRDGDIPGFVENEVNNWSLISRLHGYEQAVLQIKENPKGGASGYLSIAHLDRRSTTQGMKFPTPEDTDEYASSYIKERGTEATTMTLISKQLPDQVTRFYKKILRNKGWSIVLNDSYQSSEILILNKGSMRIELVIQELTHGDTVIFLNHVNTDA